MKNKNGQVVNIAVMAVIATVMFIAVAIPVTQDIVASANVTGTSLTILNLLPLFYAVASLLAVGSFIGIMSIVR